MEMRMRVLQLTLIGAVATMSACTWVPLTPEGEQVTVVTAAHVTTCERVGKTNAKTTDRVGAVARSVDKVKEEVTALARNEAAKMGGDSVVPVGEIEDGRQVFEVYRCR
jgi:hypothetical protein